MGYTSSQSKYSPRSGRNHHPTHCPACASPSPQPKRATPPRTSRPAILLLIALGALLALGYAIPALAAPLRWAKIPLIWPLRAARSLLRLSGTQLTLLWWDVRTTLSLLWQLLWTVLRAALRVTLCSAALYFLFPAGRAITSWALDLIILAGGLACFFLVYAVKGRDRALEIMDWFERDIQRFAAQREEEAYKQRASEAFKGYTHAQEHQQQQSYQPEEDPDSDELPELVPDDHDSGWNRQQPAQGTPQYEPPRDQGGANNRKKMYKKRGKR